MTAVGGGTRRLDPQGSQLESLVFLDRRTPEDNSRLVQELSACHSQTQPFCCTIGKAIPESRLSCGCDLPRNFHLRRETANKSRNARSDKSIDRCIPPRKFRRSGEDKRRGTLLRLATGIVEDDSCRTGNKHIYVGLPKMVFGLRLRCFAGCAVARLPLLWFWRLILSLVFHEFYLWMAFYLTDTCACIGFPVSQTRNDAGLCTLAVIDVEQIQHRTSHRCPRSVKNEVPRKRSTALQPRTKPCPHPSRYGNALLVGTSTPLRLFVPGLMMR